jgi:hypothetical protein
MLSGLAPVWTAMIVSLATAQSELPPAVEQKAQDWWRTTYESIASIREAIRQADGDGGHEWHRLKELHSKIAKQIRKRTDLANNLRLISRQSSDEYERAEALLCLVIALKDGAKNELRFALTDSSRLVKSLAIREVSNLRLRDLAPEVASCLSSSVTTIRASALSTLYNLLGADGFSYYVALLEDKDLDIVKSALYNLGECAPDDATRRLLDFLVRHAETPEMSRCVEIAIWCIRKLGVKLKESELRLVLDAEQKLRREKHHSEPAPEQ